MAWAGLPHPLETKVTPWICSGKDRFDTLNQLFDWAVAWEFKPVDKKPGEQQQQQRQAVEPQTDGDKTRNIRPSISETVENTPINSNNSVT
jgi:hypothetical protein